MQKLMRMIHKEEKGFTLVELMVVVVIIGILVAIAIPIYGTVTTNAANKAHDSNVRILKGAGAMYISTYGVPADSDLTVGTELDEFLETALGSMEVPEASTAYDTATTYTVVIKTNGEIDVTPDYVGG